MKTSITQLARRARSLWSELDYAQRRMFEIRTGIDLDALERRRGQDRTIKQLEALYAADDVAVKAGLTPHGR